MTPQDNWRPEVARLAQHQDQLERQQRDSDRNVAALQRDADALKRDVDCRMDSQRRDMDRQSADRDSRVSGLERSRDAFENLFWFSMPLIAAVAVIIILVIAVIVSREQRQEAGEPEQRSPSYMNAFPASPGGRVQPGFAAAGTPLRQHRRHPGNHGRRSRDLLSFNPSTGEERPPIESQSYRVGRVTPQFAICFLTGPADPAWSSRYLQPGDDVESGDRQPKSPIGWRPERVRVHHGRVERYNIASLRMGGGPLAHQRAQVRVQGGGPNVSVLQTFEWVVTP